MQAVHRHMMHGHFTSSSRPLSGQIHWHSDYYISAAAAGSNRVALGLFSLDGLRLVRDTTASEVAFPGDSWVRLGAGDAMESGQFVVHHVLNNLDDNLANERQEDNLYAQSPGDPNLHAVLPRPRTGAEETDPQWRADWRSGATGLPSGEIVVVRHLRYGNDRIWYVQRRDPIGGTVAEQRIMWQAVDTGVEFTGGGTEWFLLGIGTWGASVVIIARDRFDTHMRAIVLDAATLETQTYFDFDTAESLDQTYAGSGHRAFTFHPASETAMTVAGVWSDIDGVPRFRTYLFTRSGNDVTANRLFSVTLEEFNNVTPVVLGLTETTITVPWPMVSEYAAAQRGPYSLRTYDFAGALVDEQPASEISVGGTVTGVDTTADYVAEATDDVACLDYAVSPDGTLGVTLDARRRSADGRWYSEVTLYSVVPRMRLDFVLTGKESDKRLQFESKPISSRRHAGLAEF